MISTQISGHIEEERRNKYLSYNLYINQAHFLFLDLFFLDSDNFKHIFISYL